MRMIIIIILIDPFFKALFGGDSGIKQGSRVALQRVLLPETQKGKSYVN